MKRESPVRRSQSPIPQLKRVEQQKRDSRENTPLRAQSPIPNLRPVPKKGSPAPGKVSYGPLLSFMGVTAQHIKQDI